jgi:ribose transport system substrate-binding protein
MRMAALAVATLVLGIAPTLADDFHGFDVTGFDGKMLPAEQLKAMAADAAKASPPKNGKSLVIGFANLQRDIAFGVLVENGIKANAAAAGVQLLVTDNRLDGPTALANAQSFAQRHVDYAIEFQTDANFGPAVMNVFNDAGIKVTAIDIPMPGATFFGVNNPKSGFMGGSYLAQAAVEKFGADKVMAGYLVIGGLPQSGAIPAMRTDGQKSGFLASMENFPQNRIITIDTKNTLQESYTQMTNVLGRIPPGAVIMVIAINDQAAIGMLRAIKAAGRDNDAIVVGNGADEAETLAAEPDLVAATGSFPERYGNYLIPMALESLAGKPLPPAVFVTHVMVTKANICQYNDKIACKGEAPFAYKFPQSAFETYLKSLATRPELKGYEALLPKS